MDAFERLVQTSFAPIELSELNEDGVLFDASLSNRVDESEPDSLFAMEPDPIASSSSIQVVNSVSFLLPRPLTIYDFKNFIDLMKKSNQESIFAPRPTTVSCSNSLKTNDDDTSSGSDCCASTTSLVLDDKKNNKKCQVSSRLFRHQKERWMGRYNGLVKYYSTHGTCDVPYTYKEDVGLVYWVKRQRHQRKLIKQGRHSNLNKDRIHLLNIIGFNWDTHGNFWEKNYMQLQAFHKKNGHTFVPSHKDAILADWAKQQKRQYMFYAENQPSTLTPYRFSRLTKLGFYY
jgi:hypothetical protein